MHNKRKGNIGQFATGLKLTELGYSVFTEEGDISHVDMIAEKDGKLTKIQCKAVTPKDGVLQIRLQKSGPGGYKFRYEKGMFDYLSCIDLSSLSIYLVPESILDSNDKQLNLRLKKTLNNQGKGIRMASDYLPEKFL